MTRLWYSWFEDGKSQSLAVEGRLRACNQALGFPSPPDNIYYRFLYSEGGGMWTGFAQGTQESLAAGVYHDTITLGAFDKDVPLGAFHLQIDGFQWKPCTFNDGNVKDDGRGMEGYDTQCDTTGETRAIKDGAALRVQVLVARYGGFLPQRPSALPDPPPGPPLLRTHHRGSGRHERSAEGGLARRPGARPH